MNDEKRNELTEMDAFEGAELSDDMLDSIAGGLIYHDPGDASANRKEAFYVLNDDGDIIMKVGDIGKAKHWATNLHESTRVISTAEFEKLRRK